MSWATRLLAACALCSLAFGACAAPPTAPAVPPQALADAVAAAARSEIADGRIPGAVILIGRHGRTVFRGAFGDRAAAPSREPMTEDTVFDLASLTKVVATTTAIMQLVERRQLALDAPVARYWPAFARNGKQAITVRQLMIHYSGLRADLDLRTPWHGYDAAIQRIAAEKPIAPAGARYLYSDINFAALGELVRRISGEPLDVYAERHIFAPAGMRDTSFRPEPVDRIAPTAVAGGAARRGAVHDPTASRMGGVAGHAGLFSTADDLARFAEMLLDRGMVGGHRILTPRSIALMTALQSPPGAAKPRGLGWDILPAFGARTITAAGPHVFGHTGFTGTALWIDPVTATSVVILTNRVYPDGRGDAGPLRRAIADIVGARAPAGVKTGIDVLEARGFDLLAGLRVGLITNHTGRDAAGLRTIDLFGRAQAVRLAALFNPEHGLDGTLDRKVASGTEAATGLPVYSLYGETRRPTAAMLAGLDALVFDIQDAGASFYTYATTMAYAMEEAARRGLKFFVLDRPNPINAETVQGPVLDPDLTSFVRYFPLPIRHGMTMGELARLFNAEKRLGADLHVVPMDGYRRGAWYDQTGLPWMAPSPNLRSIRAAALYPGVAILEGANVSVGRGTDTPFELVGAPWIDGARFAARLAARGIAGVRFEPATFVPDADRYRGQPCHGIRLVVADRDALDAPALGVELLSALHALYPGRFEIARTLGMLGSRRVLAEVQAGLDPRAIAAGWTESLRAFQRLRAAYLLY